MYGKGISRAGEILDFAIAYDIIQKSGSWFSYHGERIGQGKDNIRKMLENDPAMLDEVEAQVRAKLEEIQNNPDAKAEYDVADEEDDFDIDLLKEDGESSGTGED